MMLNEKGLDMESLGLALKYITDVSPDWDSLSTPEWFVRLAHYYAFADDLQSVEPGEFGELLERLDTAEPLDMASALPSDAVQAIRTLITERDRLREALEDANNAISEEINYSNYDHETVCCVGAMWDEAHGIIQSALGDQQ